MELYNLVSNVNNFKRLKIGLIAINKKNQVLLIKEDLKRIYKTVYNIPTIDIDYVQENNIIAKFNDEYNLEIDKLFGYVNRIKMLDDKCEKVEQINLYTKINDNISDLDDMIFRNIDTIEEYEFIPENVKDTLEIVKYNKEVIKRSVFNQ